MTAAAILYAAKSTEDKHGSIPTQLADCRTAALGEDLDVVAEYSDEGFSAYSGNRGLGLEQAMAHAERLVAEGAEAHLFVVHSDRLARGDARTARHVIEYALWAIKADVRLRSLQDPQTFADLLYAAVTGQRNHEDSKRKSEATRAGKKREAQRGRPHGGIAPYGYRYEGKREDCRLVPEPAEAVVVRRIYQSYAAGESQLAILRALNADGIPTKRGAPRWAQGTLVAILRNPAYIGKVRHRGEVYDGEHEPLIETELWLRVERMRKAADSRPGRGRGRRPNGCHLFVKGMLRCGTCGGPMVPRSTPDRYYCLTRHENGPDACSQVPVPRDRIDREVLRYFEQVGLDFDSTRAAAEAALAHELDQAAALRAQAERERMKVDDALRRAKADYRSGAIDGATFAELRTEWEAELVALAGQLERLAGHEAELVAGADSIDAETAVLEQLTAIRRAVAGDVRSAEGLDAVRAALAALFESFTLLDAPAPLPTPQALQLASRDPRAGAIVAGLLGEPLDVVEQIAGAPVDDVAAVSLDAGYVVVPRVRREALAALDPGFTPVLRKVPLASGQTITARPRPLILCFGPIAVDADPGGAPSPRTRSDAVPAPQSGFPPRSQNARNGVAAA